MPFFLNKYFQFRISLITEISVHAEAIQICLLNTQVFAESTYVHAATKLVNTLITQGRTATHQFRHSKPLAFAFVIPARAAITQARASTIQIFFPRLPHLRLTFPHVRQLLKHVLQPLNDSFCDSSKYFSVLLTYGSHSSTCLSDCRIVIILK